MRVNVPRRAHRTALGPTCRLLSWKYGVSLPAPPALKRAAGSSSVKVPSISRRTLLTAARLYECKPHHQCGPCIQRSRRTDELRRASAAGKSFTKMRWSTPLGDYRDFGSRRLMARGEGVSRTRRLAIGPICVSMSTRSSTTSQRHRAARSAARPGSSSAPPPQTARPCGDRQATRFG